MRWQPFKAHDLRELDVQIRHRAIRDGMTDGAYVLEGPRAWTLWDGDEPIACGGIYQDQAWVFLGRDMRRYMVMFTNKVRQEIEAHGRSVWTEIDEDHPEAVRWAELLGMTRRAPGMWSTP